MIPISQMGKLKAHKNTRDFANLTRQVHGRVRIPALESWLQCLCCQPLCTTSLVSSQKSGGWNATEFLASEKTRGVYWVLRMYQTLWTGLPYISSFSPYKQLCEHCALSFAILIDGEGVRREAKTSSTIFSSVRWSTQNSNTASLTSEPMPSTWCHACNRGMMKWRILRQDSKKLNNLILFVSLWTSSFPPNVQCAFAFHNSSKMEWLQDSKVLHFFFFPFFWS